MSLPPSEIPQGAIRFNTDSQRLEFYAQDQWWVMSTRDHDYARIPSAGGLGDQHLGARAAWPLGGNSYTQLDGINTASLGNSHDFGDLTDTVYECGSLSSSTRGITAMSYTNPSTVRDIDLTILSTGGQSTSFGLLVQANRISGAASNQNRGIFCAGGPSPFTNLIQYVSIASNGDAVDFEGNSTFSGAYLTGFGSPTRAVFAGGGAWPSATNNIQYVHYGSTGIDASNFGDLTTTRVMIGGSSNATRGILMGGLQSAGGTTQNEIEYVQISSTGNSIDFGDLTFARYQGSGFASSTRSFYSGGSAPGATYDAIEYVQIATTGNSVDFGNSSFGHHSGGGGMSTGHGGL